MSHSHEHAVPATTPFSPETIAAFREDDKGAAKAIVVLMSGIFTLGLILYLGVCWCIVN